MWWKVVLALCIVPLTLDAQSAAGRREAGVLLTYSFLREIGSSDAGVGTEAGGIGGKFVYQLLRHVDIEGEMILLPGSQASGNRAQGFFGGKFGIRRDRFGLFIKARPGFIYFSNSPFGEADPGGGGSFFSHDFASATEASMDLGGVAEYYTRRGPILRFDLGDTIIGYGTRTVRISQQQEIQAGGFTTHNWQGSFGISFRF